MANLATTSSKENYFTYPFVMGCSQISLQSVLPPRHITGIVFRLIEYSQGLDSSIPLHEAYQYVFDSTTMLLALVLLNMVHPGRIMPGNESDFPIRKQRKAAGKKIRGRASRFGDALSLHQTEPSEIPSEQATMEPTGPEV